MNNLYYVKCKIVAVGSRRAPRLDFNQAGRSRVRCIPEPAPRAVRAALAGFAARAAGRGRRSHARRAPRAAAAPRPYARTSGGYVPRNASSSDFPFAPYPAATVRLVRFWTHPYPNFPRVPCGMVPTTPMPKKWVPVQAGLAGPRPPPKIPSGNSPSFQRFPEPLREFWKPTLFLL